MINKTYRYLLAFLFKFTLCSILQAQPPSLNWEHFYGGSKVDFLGRIEKTFDHGFAIGGHGQSTDGDLSVIMNGGASDLELIRLDSCGNRIWGRLIGGNFIEYLYGITETTDHGFLLTGFTTSTNLTNGYHGGVEDAVACKLDANGNLQWIKTFGGSGNDFFYNAVSLPDSSCIVVGSTISLDGDGNPSGGQGGWVVKLDKNGNIIWKKFPGLGGFSDIKATADGNYILCGNGFTKIDASGNLLWQRIYGTASLYSVENVIGSGYIAGGNVADNFGNNDGIAICIDDNGNLLWQRTVGGSLQDVIADVAVLAGNTFVFAGSSTSSDGDVPSNNGLTDGFAFALDDNGTLLWTRGYGGPVKDEFLGVASGNDGSLLLSGYSGSRNGNNNPSVGKWDFMLLKLKATKSKIVDTVACRSLLLNNILIMRDTIVIDTLKDQCNNDSAFIKYKVTITPTETVRTLNNTAVNFLDKTILTTTSSAPVTWTGPGLSCYNCLSPMTSPALHTTSYIVKAGSGSCVATDTVIISIKATDTLYIPSAFTPNADGKNDIFNALGMVNDFYMEIYNRWGQRIFTTRSLLNGWDGKCKGTVQPSGTYVYFIKYSSRTNTTKLLKGTFTLIR